MFYFNKYQKILLTCAKKIKMAYSSACDLKRAKKAKKSKIFETLGKNVQNLKIFRPCLNQIFKLHAGKFCGIFFVLEKCFS